jgi:hypothetical protein
MLFLLKTQKRKYRRGRGLWLTFQEAPAGEVSGCVFVEVLKDRGESVQSIVGMENAKI